MRSLSFTAPEFSSGSLSAIQAALAAVAAPAGAAIRAHRSGECNKLLNRLQDARDCTCTLCVCACAENAVARHCVIVRPLLPGVWRHPLRRAQPLLC